MKIYQLSILTVIAVFLVLIFLRTPIPFTRENIKSGKVKPSERPLIGGDIDVSGSAVEVSGSVDINNTVSVEIE